MTKRIELYDEGGKLLRMRKSPRQGKLWDLFKVLLYAPELPGLAGLSIELAPVDILEQRVQDGRGSWRRRGARILDKSLTACYPPVLLAAPMDYYRFLPFKGREAFTRRDLAERAQIDADLAGKTLYVLLKMGLVRRTEKQGRSWVYRLNSKNTPIRRGSAG
jgi:hypothetical protein